MLGHLIDRTIALRHGFQSVIVGVNGVVAASGHTQVVFGIGYAATLEVLGMLIAMIDDFIAQWFGAHGLHADDVAGPVVVRLDSHVYSLDGWISARAH